MKIMNIIKTAATALLALTFAVSCDDWTETESVDLHYVSLAEKNPDLYKAYLQSLREYRESEHKVVIAKFENKSTVPGGRADHLNCLPDSVDYVILKNPAMISEAIASEIEEVRSLKGMKILYEISYDAFAAEYKATVKEPYNEYLAQWIAEHPNPAEGEAPAPIQPLSEFLTAKVNEALAIFDEKAYDGINVVYNGINPLSLKNVSYADNDRQRLYEAQRAFFEPLTEWSKWKDANADGFYFFEGTPNYILSQTGENEYEVAASEFIAGAKYILIPALSAATNSAIALKVESPASWNNFPTDRFIICTTTLSLTDPNATDGLFSQLDQWGNTQSAIVGAANWVVSQNVSYGKAGISVDNAQNDYYDITKVYRNIRTAIQIMNPSPKK